MTASTPLTPAGRMNDTRAALEDLLARRILIVDGAMGTMLQRHKLTEPDFRGERFADHASDLQGNNDILVLTRPDVVESVHDEYLAAGADIVETNTFNGTSISQADYATEHLVREINVEAARIARKAAARWTEKTPDKPRFVAGAVGPTNKTLSISPDVNDPSFRAATYDELYASYREQIEGLIEGGVDVVLIETIFDTLNSKAAVMAYQDAVAASGRDVPLMISVTITDRSGRTLSGQTIEAFWASIAHSEALSVGINCALGADEMRPYVEALSNHATTFTSCYPNAGLPNAMGEYDEPPERTAQLLKEFAQDGFVNMLGGCCGTTPDHIRAIADAVKETDPRERPKSDRPFAVFSGLEPLTVIPKDSGFMMVGERTNVTGSRQVRQADHSPTTTTTALEVALDQVRGGANLHRRQHGRGHARFRAGDDDVPQPDRDRARSLPSMPIMIDSSKWSVIEAGLKCAQGKGVVNSISLKEGEADFLEKANATSRASAPASW